MMAPEQVFFVRENLKLRLQGARLAILARQYEAARADLAAYAQAHAVRWIDDPSNAVADADRNFLRLQVLPLLRHFRGSGHVVRFIEYMDVGTCNGWRRDQVVTSAHLRDRIAARWPLRPLQSQYRGEVAERYAFADGGGDVLLAGNGGDVLNAGDGNNYLQGGSGADLLTAASVGNVTLLANGGGHDTLDASGSSGNNLFGLGFDILFGFTGLLSFGQSAFFGTGGMVAAYLMTVMNFPHVITALFIGMIAAGVIGYLVGLIALRRTGIYFAMITVAIAEVFFFVEFNPLSDFTGGENGLPGVPTPSLNLGFTTINFNTDWTLYVFLAFWYFVGLVIALRIVRSPVGAVLSAIRDNPLRAAAVGHNIHGYKLTAFVIAAAYAGFAGGLLGIMQGFMPPDAFMFDTSGQLVMQTAIGGAGTLFGPLVGATVWLYLSDFFQTTLHLGATWKLVLGVVFVLLVCFLRRGIVGGLVDLAKLVTEPRHHEAAESDPTAVTPARSAAEPAAPVVAIVARGGRSRASAGMTRRSTSSTSSSPSRTTSASTPR